jgi:hypothetical protein
MMTRGIGHVVGAVGGETCRITSGVATFAVILQVQAVREQRGVEQSPARLIGVGQRFQMRSDQRRIGSRQIHAGW